MVSVYICFQKKVLCSPYFTLCSGCFQKGECFLHDTKVFEASLKAHILLKKNTKISPTIISSKFDHDYRLSNTIFENTVSPSPFPPKKTKKKPPKCLNIRYLLRKCQR